MDASSNQSGNYSVTKDELIFCEGRSIQSIKLLLQGKVGVYISEVPEHGNMSDEEILKSSYKLFEIGQNIFIGAKDLLIEKNNSYSYRTVEPTNLYAFPASDEGQAKALINSQKDYATYVITSISTLISCSYTALGKLRSFAAQLQYLTDNLTTYYWELKEKYGFKAVPSAQFLRDGVENLNRMRDKSVFFPSQLSEEFLKADHSAIYDSDTFSFPEINSSKIDYYIHLTSIPVEARKIFFGANEYIALFHCKDAAKVLDDLQASIKEVLAAASIYFRRLYSEGEECIFSEYVKAAGEITSSPNGNILLEALSFIVNEIIRISAVYERQYGHKTSADIDYLHNMYRHVKANAEKRASDNNGAMEIEDMAGSIPDELWNSARKILEYADLPKDRFDLFWSNLEAFRNLNDKYRLDNDTSRIRSALSSVFFEIYESVFKKVYTEKNTSKLFHMFLNFGYMDERLMKTPHTLELYRLENRLREKSQGSVYTVYKWLTKIYEMEKDPSLNEFGLDYYDVFREMKKRGEVKDKDKQQYENDANARLKHEINNMFRINHKLCFGQISVYTPILHSDMITRDLWKTFVTPELINQSISKILETDFSAFHREVSYRNQEKGIEKEFIMKSVTPDIILLPTFGAKASMWQELTGRNRSSPGRFILPIFTSENIDELIVKLVGNFRWELCRTMMGSAWNDVTQKSLTSEYTDYIQFYKKNRDLSEEAKEKVKAQIERQRNRMREIFTSDYELWLNYESKGIMRLNKVARGILYRSCPLAKPIRDSLSKQPAYTEVAAQFNIQRAKQAKELENHYTKLIRSGIVLDSELEENLRFYKES